MIAATVTKMTLTHWATVIKNDIESEMERLAEELSSASRDDQANCISSRVDVIRADFLRNLQGLVEELTNREIETLPE